jgi:hypothetical protein
MEKKTYSVSVDTTPFYVQVEAKDEDEAKEIVQGLLEEGRCTNEADETYYVVGKDIEEVSKEELNLKFEVYKNV